ncbi:DNA-binding domain-containing protein [Uliginosibacterium gangwonense]|uniref:HvfC/BufC N-terminal domain-containing protein n=1 Tax=Uliginosibacterium gangwonense TaxID=392736 RepID=UPI0003619A33|nr:DNA-binding domain-containing protein [Uliginosibacterium gangwonense]
MNPSMCAHWAQALHDPKLPVQGLRTWNGSDPQQRFAVYRNNVIASLSDALAETFPVVRACMGEAIFRSIAIDFVRTHPPVDAVLARYGQGFSAYLAACGAAEIHPCLPDLAMLEWAYVCCFHAASGQPIELEMLYAYIAEPDALGRVRLKFQPALEAVSSTYAIVSLWGAHQRGEMLSLSGLHPPESAWILREGLQTMVLRVGEADVVFLRALQAGASLAGAAEQAFAADEAFDLGRCLGALLRYRLITGVEQEGLGQ